MKIIISGATGFIGRALVQALLERGDTVVALTRDARRGTAILGSAVEVIEWNPPGLGPWMNVFNGADGVVNLAGEPIQEELWAPAERAWLRGGPINTLPELAGAAAKMATGAVTGRQRSPAEQDRILQSRLQATEAIAAALAQANPRPSVLVSGSAIGFYGSRGAEILTERSGPGSDFLAKVIQAWEDAAKAIEQLGVRIVLVRTGIVLGRGDGALPELAMPFRLFSGGTMGYPNQWVSWIHLEDEVGIIIEALTNPEIQGAVNATAPNPVTMRQFSREIGQALGRPAWVPFMPAVLRLALGERADVVLASQRVLPEKLQQAGYRFKRSKSREALRSLLSEQ